MILSGVAGSPITTIMNSVEWALNEVLREVLIGVQRRFAYNDRFCR